ncbi:hypothetical protein CUPS4064_09520 [Campylobacter upsaliensis]|uniref:hypothetical protein n=1 Tax=Campylobacter upsaliensis TaxID=28080 RepID=UPI002149EF6F|nr:hypothetical protein [Campylobacter upsaliensis]MCR2114370.1 hypothetical protein [Campylobacter upsaliensis]
MPNQRPAATRELNECLAFFYASRHTKRRFKNDEIKRRSILRLAKGSFCKKF